MFSVPLVPTGATGGGYVPVAGGAAHSGLSLGAALHPHLII